MTANTKSRTVIEYIVDIWIDDSDIGKMTILNEKVIIEEKIEEIIDVVRKTYGKNATYNAAKENRVFTF